MSIIKPNLEYWTPQIAHSMTRLQHPGQRGVNDKQISILRRLWDEDQWEPGMADPIALCNGALVNGNAPAKMISQLPKNTMVPVYVIRDLPEDMLYLLDWNRAKRSWGNLLKYDYPKQSVTNLNVVASIAQMNCGYRGNVDHMDLSDQVKYYYYLDLAEFVAQHSESLFRAASLARQIHRLESDLPGTVGTVTTMGFVLWRLREHDGAEAFFDSYAHREPHGLHDPRSRMLRYYRRIDFDLNRRNRRHTHYITKQRVADLFGAWDAHLHGYPWKPWDGTLANFKAY